MVASARFALNLGYLAIRNGDDDVPRFAAFATNGFDIFGDGSIIKNW